MPTRRPEAAAETIAKWRRQGIEPFLYIDDDMEQAFQSPVSLQFTQQVISVRLGYPNSINALVASIRPGTWQAVICGSDDLWPKYDDGPLVCAMIEEAFAGNYDQVLWPDDGWELGGNCSKHCTHAIVGIDWYSRHNRIFDPGFRHYYCDTDLHQTAAAEGKLKDMRRRVKFEHRHHTMGKTKRDEVHEANRQYHAADQAYYRRKHKGGILEA